MTGLPILVAVDLTETEATRAVLREAIFEAETRSRPVIVMAVVPEVFVGLDWRYAIRGGHKATTAAERRDIVRQTLERLNDLVADETSEDIEVDTHAVLGPPYQMILRMADETRAAMIVIGAGGSGGPTKELGSHATRVVRHASCSVLVVR